MPYKAVFLSSKHAEAETSAATRLRATKLHARDEADYQVGSPRTGRAGVTTPTISLKNYILKETSLITMEGN